MVEKQNFMDTLHAVEEVVKTQGTPLTKSEVMEYFKDMELSGEQKDLVYEYLLTKPKEEKDSPSDYKVEKLQNSTQEQKQAEDKFLKSSYVKMYLDDIAAVERLEEEAMKSHYAALLAGEKDAVPVIVNQFLHRVIEIAKRYVLLNVRMEDVVQEGNMALVIAVNDLLGRGEQPGIEEYLQEQIQSAMEQFIDQTLEDENWENAVLSRARLLNEAREALAKELMHVPSLTELSDYTKLSEKEISDIMALIKENTKK